MFGQSVEIQDGDGIDDNDGDCNADCGDNVHGAVNETFGESEHCEVAFVQSECCLVVQVSPVRNG